jgi:hypothetical protein
MNLAHTTFKTSIYTTLLGLGVVSGAFAAGSYVENFESYSSISYVGQKSTTLANGAEVWGNNGSAATAVNIYANNSPSWKGLRLAQDGTGGTIGTYVIGTVENPSTRVNSFTASFDLLLKNGSGSPADRFAFHFGSMLMPLPNDTENGLWDGRSMLSLVWDFYDNTSGSFVDYIGTGSNRGVELYKNGSLVSGTQVNNPVPVQTGLSGSFTRVNLRYDEELNGGTFTFNTGGTVGAGNLISGGTDVFTKTGLGVNFAAGDKFAFSAATGGSEMDVFIDNVSINTVPEPGSGALLMLGVGGLIALRRTRRSHE